MKLHILTIGRPKLPYAKLGWEDYTGRLSRQHQLRVTHLADKYVGDSRHILAAAGSASLVALVIEGEQLDSQQLAAWLDTRAGQGRELCFVVGGPDGLPAEVISRAEFRWSLSRLTMPHDLAMVVLAEALYRASSINGGQPYHRG